MQGKKSENRKSDRNNWKIGISDRKFRNIGSAKSENKEIGKSDRKNRKIGISELIPIPIRFFFGKIGNRKFGNRHLKNVFQNRKNRIGNRKNRNVRKKNTPLLSHIKIRVIYFFSVSN